MAMDSVQLIMSLIADPEADDRTFLEDLVKRYEGDDLSLSKTFAFLQYSEEEIEKAQQRYPDKADEIWDSFLILAPVLPQMHNYSPDLYRHHCAELLDRVAAGEDIDEPTTAEILVTLCETSLMTPLRHDAAVLYARLFKQVFGSEQINRLIENIDMRETWDGAANELLSRIVKRMEIHRLREDD